MKVKPPRKKCGKLPYADRRGAKRAMLRQQRNGTLAITSTLETYRCTHCPGKVWHLGNRKAA